MTRPDGHECKMSAISEVNFFLSRKACIMTKRSVMKEKGGNPVPVKWVFKSKEDPDGLIHLKNINVVKGSMQVPGVEFTESLSPFASYTSTRIMIGLNLYHK